MAPAEIPIKEQLSNAEKENARLKRTIEKLKEFLIQKQNEEEVLNFQIDAINLKVSEMKRIMDNG